MGTNYYARIKECPHCNRYDEIHIGKSSMGWTFSFHATEDIRSYKDWLKILSQPNTSIYDEYGEKISLKDFKGLVKAKENEPHNHTIACKDTSYLDEDGHSMSPYEFS